VIDFDWRAEKSDIAEPPKIVILKLMKTH